MVWLWSALVAVVSMTVALLPWQRRRRQSRFIRELLSDAGKAPDSRRIIVSLSTLADRIGNLEPTIRCLLEQTRPPDEIIVAVPDFSTRQQKAYVVPKYLSQLPKVRILRCGKDWGPATKFVPVIQEELAAGRGDTLILVVDDDRIYPRDALETYLYYNRKLPDGALCFRGAAIRRRAKKSALEIFVGSRIRHPQPVAVMTGCASYLIQPRFFDAQLWDYSAAPAAAFYMDDIWISGWLDRRQVPKYLVPASAMMRSVAQQTRTMTLHDVPGGRLQSNKEVIAFFRETWKVWSERSK
jgi:glycosyltransferase involved in cell wall biosynthesis